MNIIVKSIALWLADTFIACIIELFLWVCLNTWNRFIEVCNVSRTPINIAQLYGVSDYKDASTSYDLSDICNETLCTDTEDIITFGECGDQTKMCPSNSIHVNTTENTDNFPLPDFEKNGVQGNKVNQFDFFESIENCQVQTATLTLNEESYHEETEKVLGYTEKENREYATEIPFANTSSEEKDLENGLSVHPSCHSSIRRNVKELVKKYSTLLLDNSEKCYKAKSELLEEPVFSYKKLLKEDDERSLINNDLNQSIPVDQDKKSTLEAGKECRNQKAEDIDQMCSTYQAVESSKSSTNKDTLSFSGYLDKNDSSKHEENALNYNMKYKTISMFPCEMLPEICPPEENIYLAMAQSNSRMETVSSQNYTSRARCNKRPAGAENTAQPENKEEYFKVTNWQTILPSENSTKNADKISCALSKSLIDSEVRKNAEQLENNFLPLTNSQANRISARESYAEVTSDASETGGLHYLRYGFIHEPDNSSAKPISKNKSQESIEGIQPIILKKGFKEKRRRSRKVNVSKVDFRQRSKNSSTFVPEKENMVKEDRIVHFNPQVKKMIFQPNLSMVENKELYEHMVLTDPLKDTVTKMRPRRFADLTEARIRKVVFKENHPSHKATNISVDEDFEFNLNDLLEDPPYIQHLKESVTNNPHEMEEALLGRSQVEDIGGISAQKQKNWRNVDTEGKSSSKQTISNEKSSYKHILNIGNGISSRFKTLKVNSKVFANKLTKKMNKHFKTVSDNDGQ